jgi:acyl-coenzyme A thioesterase PaaI-like protein
MMSQSSRVLSLWQRWEKLPAGKWFFSALVCIKAPYFSSIKPRFDELRPGYCKLHIKKRRAVLNHINTVHAIAMCNMAELAAGVMMDVTIPRSHRWIPKGMTVEYLKKAQSDLHAIATLDAQPECGAAAEVPVTVNVVDEQQQTVVRAVITMWVSPKST